MADPLLDAICPQTAFAQLEIESELGVLERNELFWSVIICRRLTTESLYGFDVALRCLMKLAVLSPEFCEQLVIRSDLGWGFVWLRIVVS